MPSEIPKQKSILNGSDLNGHVGRDADAYGGVHGGMVNTEGQIILEFSDAVGMAVCNTYFKKEDSNCCCCCSPFSPCSFQYGSIASR